MQNVTLYQIPAWYNEIVRERDEPMHIHQPHDKGINRCFQARKCSLHFSEVL
jgi:hypothetical protein